VIGEFAASTLVDDEVTAVESAPAGIGEARVVSAPWALSAASPNMNGRDKIRFMNLVWKNSLPDATLTPLLRHEVARATIFTSVPTKNSLTMLVTVSAPTKIINPMLILQ
jgi:hypothetical protein